MALPSVREPTEQVARRYHRAGRKERAVLLDEFVETAGYSHKYAIHPLNSWGRTRMVRIDGRMVKLIVRPAAGAERAPEVSSHPPP